MAANIIIGIDTRKSTHVAVAINEQGARLQEYFTKADEAIRPLTGSNQRLLN